MDTGFPFDGLKTPTFQAVPAEMTAKSPEFREILEFQERKSFAFDYCLTTIFHKADYRKPAVLTYMRP